MTRTLIRPLAYALLGASALASFMLPRSLTVPQMYASTTPNQITITGIVRDFPASHPDFDVSPADGNGHYAGNVATLLASDGRPLQVHGVKDFVVSFGSLVPGVPYAASATVLGADITSGMDPVPVTIMAETDSETFEPFGAYLDPAAADVNDGANPREFVFSLTDVYSASTPIAITATSWLAGAGDTQFGHETGFSGTDNKADSSQVATQIAVAQGGSVTSISAYVKGTDGVMYGLYTDNAGEPGTLVVDTNSTDSPSELSWFTKSVTPTWIAAGTYWLAISQDESHQQYSRDSSGGQTRINSYDAENNGFQSTWSGTTSSSTERLNMYLTMTPDAGSYTEHMTVNSGVDSPYVEVLVDGDAVPNIPAFQDQSSILTYVESYVDVDSGLMTLNDNQAIYLFELGTTNLTSPSADFQDLVILVTLATDPAYFFVAGTSTEGLNPIGYKVDAQWTDSAGHSIAPHMYKPSQGDSGGTRGVTSSGGVTSPATYYEWYRDIVGSNLSMTSDIVLTDDGTGVYEYQSNAHYPADGRMYGNEGSAHNSHFTQSFNATFTYDDSASQFVELQGGDGAWVYVNGKLAIDLGGMQTGVTQYADMDRLGMTTGNDYEISIFYANRSSSSSQFNLRTNIELHQGDVLGYVTSAFD